MDAVDRAALQGLKQLARWDNLVSVEQLDFHFTIGGGVDIVDNRLGHMLSQCRARIGLKAPFDRFLRTGNRWCRQRRGTGKARLFNEITSRGHDHLLV